MFEVLQRLLADAAQIGAANVRETGARQRVELQIDLEPTLGLRELRNEVRLARDAQADRAGIDPATLSFSIPVQTANGSALTAATTIGTVTLGPIVERNVRALVARPEALTTSLLGHTFLDRLDSYEVRGGRMVLRGRN